MHSVVLPRTFKSREQQLYPKIPSGTVLCFHYGLATHEHPYNELHQYVNKQSTMLFTLMFSIFLEIMGIDLPSFPPISGGLIMTNALSPYFLYC